MQDITVDQRWGGEAITNVHGDVSYQERKFKVASPFDPSGDQEQAIELLSAGIARGERYQTLKGVTGSGKTYTMAKIIEQVQRPTLVLSHNKTLAAQLYREFKSFFPDNSVEYFVSTYDYYQPEAYVPGKDLYIEKETDINQEIDRLRLNATFSLMERRDVIVVATVSCIFGLANPVSVRDMVYTFPSRHPFNYAILPQLVRMQYERNDAVLKRGAFRVKGDTIEICPSYLRMRCVSVSIGMQTPRSSGSTRSAGRSRRLSTAIPSILPSSSSCPPSRSRRRSAGSAARWRSRSSTSNRWASP